MPAVRTFVAIELSSEILEALESIVRQLRAGSGGAAGRWVGRDSVHLTLKFLGDVDAARLPAVYRAVEAATKGYPPFSLRPDGLGCFPNLRHPRVIWVGVREETGHLPRLQSSIERGLVPLGFPPEARAFSPHLTLARVHDRATPGEVQALAQAVAAFAVSPMPEMLVDAVYVIKSDLHPGGAVYTPLHRATLGATAQAFA